MLEGLEVLEGLEGLVEGLGRLEGQGGSRNVQKER